MLQIPNNLAAGDEVADFVNAFPADDCQQNSHSLLELQAFRLRERFDISWQVARLTAELAYGFGGRRAS